MEFKTYVPQDPSLRRYCSSKKSDEDMKALIDQEIGEALQEAEKQVTKHMTAINAFPQDYCKLIQPAEQNADLKRDLRKTLEKLEHKTILKLQELSRSET